MLVIHWAKQNKTNTILSNGIRPACRKDRETGEPKNAKGVYVFPYSRNKTLMGNWRRNLKTWDTTLGNYNGFVFRLEPEDFPLLAGDWFFNRDLDGLEAATMQTPEQLMESFGAFFSGEIVNHTDEDGYSRDWSNFEMILPFHIPPSRIIKIIKDREPKRRQAA